MNSPGAAARCSSLSAPSGIASSAGRFLKFPGPLPIELAACPREKDCRFARAAAARLRARFKPKCRTVQRRRRKKKKREAARRAESRVWESSEITSHGVNKRSRYSLIIKGPIYISRTNYYRVMTRVGWLFPGTFMLCTEVAVSSMLVHGIVWNKFIMGWRKWGKVED